MPLNILRYLKTCTTSNGIYLLGISIQCGLVLSLPKYPDVVRHFGLKLLEETIKLKWNDMPTGFVLLHFLHFRRHFLKSTFCFIKDQKVFIKENAMRLMESGVVDIVSEAVHIKVTWCHFLVYFSR